MPVGVVQLHVEWLQPPQDSQASRPQPVDDPAEITSTAAFLLENVLQEGDRFRLIGIHCTNLSADASDQLGLWTDQRLV